jgi:hypothetical protein
MAHARQLVGGGEAGRSAADDRHFLAGLRFGAANFSLFWMAYSPRKCSTELMPTWSSTSLRLQPVSQGAGQTRPITEGKGLASVRRRQAYSCHGIVGLPSAPTGGFSTPRTMFR